MTRKDDEESQFRSLILRLIHFNKFCVFNVNGRSRINVKLFKIVVTVTITM